MDLSEVKEWSVLVQLALMGSFIFLLCLEVSLRTRNVTLKKKLPGPFAWSLVGNAMQLGQMPHLMFIIFLAEKAKLQEQINKVVGHHRLPSVEDKANLALCLVAMTIPHSSTSDVTIEGLLVFFNQLSINHNPQM
ncbi:hypothetical protein MHYP_G00138980 [Metynnis hypsauchen]